VDSKRQLRKRLRAVRREHAAALPESTRALLFLRPPAALLGLFPDDATVGLYRAEADEAPTGAYARFFLERGHAIALPRFAERDSPMAFARHADPYAETDLAAGPFGLMQPGDDAEPLVPQVLFAPLLGFTANGERLGRGGGHYDRWLAEHPGTIAIGMAWDCQLVDAMPGEEHDVPLTAVVTPTRLYGPFG
jgi:5-formyltetrahydrofolate cyclo-ligase